MKLSSTIPLLALCTGLGSEFTFGQSQSASTNYSLLHAPPTGGGGQISNGSSIKAEITVGDDIAGPVSNFTTGGVQEKPNYIGQLYDVLSIAVTATPGTVNEGSGRQLGALGTLDDATTLALAASQIQWSVLLGPLTGIDSSGLATADVVFQDTIATAQGSYQNKVGQLILTVLDIDSDNFGDYAGDALDDDWQVSHFGSPPNLEAAPAANPDGDPHNNLIEFLTGYDPNNPGSFFSLSVIALNGTTSTVELSKIVPGTRYRLERTNDLAQSAPWTEFINFTTAVEAGNHQLNDPDAIGPRWFYRVGVEAE